MVGKHQDRHGEMRELAIAVKAELNRLADRTYGKHFNSWITASLDARLDKSPLRAYYTHQIGSYALSLAPAHQRLLWSRASLRRILDIQHCAGRHPKE